MNEKIAIITDSCADILKPDQEKYGIFVIPLLIMDQGKSYRDGIDITVEEIYEIEKTRLLKSASPEGADMMKIIDSIKEQGYTKAIAIMLSGGLSGTYNSMRLLAESEDDIEIAVYDSKSGSIGYGAICIQLAKYIEQGMSFEELKGKTEQLIKDTYIYFFVDTLELLEKGGRVGKASYLLGSALKIKPVLTVEKEEGQISVSSKIRGSKKMYSKLVELLNENIKNYPNKKYNVLISDGGMPEERKILEKELKTNFPDYVDFINSNIGGLLSCYIGKGVLGAAIQFLDD